ncbi:Telomerase-binding EST1A [Madurella fahalii]|uniref:Telomerase-binding EST1A n=1 Tax=Madurella fahalii TaxID=1157608 RepID=A0ABQ0G1I7_9PEZI
MDPVTKKWNEHLRRESRKSKRDPLCPHCGREFQIIQNAAETPLALFERHISDVHAQLLSEKATEAEKGDWIRSQWEAAQSPSERDGSKPGVSSSEATPKPVRTVIAGESNQPSPNRRKPVDRDSAGAAGAVAQVQQSQDRRTKSRTPSIKREGSTSRSVSPPKRSKARPTSAHVVDDGRNDFDRGSYQKGRLWNPDDDATSPRPRPYDKSNVASNQRQRVSSSSAAKPPRQSQPAPASDPWPPAPADDEPTEIIKQPETRPISQEQLVAEVKGIYAGLVMVESKCIEVDNAQSSQNDASNKLNNEQWQALIALHRTLLHEHHDFFLASQHPSASPALRRLAAKYAMPARMWRHGIHSFLELLRHRLPASLDHMLTFIYLAYSMMALLYETVPAFEDTWIECLGDLGRYRMAIEDDDIRDREVWTAVSRHWYSKASDKAPTTGRLYHHLAILARPNALQQLYYYAKSLCVEMPFVSARESIMTLFEPIMAPTPNPQQSRLPPTEFALVKTHGILFSGKQQGELEATMKEYFELLDNYINRSARRWLEPGYCTGIANCCAVVGYGGQSNPVFNAIRGPRPDDEQQDQLMEESGANSSSLKELVEPLKLFNGTVNVVARRFGDPNILPFLHVTLVFIHHLTFYPEAMVYIARDFPWKLTALMLNTLIGSYQSYARIEGEQFPKSEPVTRPLPDDYALRGFPWVEKYFPNGWFSNDKIDDDEKYFEVASMTEERKERALWLGCRIAAQDGKWLRYDPETHQFSVNPQYEVKLELELPATPVDSIDYGELPDAAAIA